MFSLLTITVDPMVCSLELLLGREYTLLDMLTRDCTWLLSDKLIHSL